MRSFHCKSDRQQVLTCRSADTNSKSVNSCIPKPLSLIGFWPGDGNGQDLSGNENHGSFSGSYVPGKTGQAFSIQGSSNVVTIQSDPILEPAILTINTWIRGSQPTDYKWIVAKGASGCDSGSYGIYVTPNANNIRTIVYNGFSFGIASGTVAGIWDGNWHMITGSYDGSSVKLYVDGSLINSVAYSFPIDYNLATDDNLIIGGYNFSGCPPGNNYSFEGDIDEVQLYSGALSDGEILSLFNAGADSICRFVEVVFSIRNDFSSDSCSSHSADTCCIHIKPHGVTIVEIYGTATLDVGTIECSSLKLSGLLVKTNKGKFLCKIITRLDQSPYPILKVTFDNTSGVIDNTSSEILLSGYLKDGTLIGGEIPRCPPASEGT